MEKVEWYREIVVRYGMVVMAMMDHGNYKDRW